MRANTQSWNAKMLNAYEDYLGDDAEEKTIDDFSIWDGGDTDGDFGDFEEYLFSAYDYFADRTFDKSAIQISKDIYKQYFDMCQPEQCTYRYTERRLTYSG